MRLLLSALTAISVFPVCALAATKKLATATAREVEEMILGVRPAPLPSTAKPSP